MNKMPLARMEKVSLREVWETEEGDFTPWLAHEDNVTLLGETIGLDLEVEVSPSPFSRQKTGFFKVD